MNRREFLAAGAAASLQGAAPSPFIKSICSTMFPAAMPLAEKFQQARNAGFKGIELRFGSEILPDWTADQVKQTGEAARRAGIEIASMWVAQTLGPNPLNSPDPEARARGVASIEKAIEFATYLNCGALLLYPCRVGSGPNFQVGYETTWERVTVELKKVIPAAQAARVLLTPENVWNKFLLSPLEMRAFVDQFQSPWLQTHFDIGNVMQYGYPQDWILTLGSRIRRIHVKDYKLSTRAEQGHFVDLLQGDVDWKQVMAALVKTGYRGFLSPEIDHDPNDPDKPRKVSDALDQILAMA